MVVSSESLTRRETFKSDINLQMLIGGPWVKVIVMPDGLGGIYSGPGEVQFIAV